MKNLFVCMILLVLHAQPILGQRAANQNLFKQRNKLEFKTSDDKNYDGFGRSNNANLSNTYSKFFTIEAKALMNVKADRFLAVFNLTQVGKTATETDQLINQRIEGFINDLQTLSVSRDDIYTDMIYLIPTFEFEVQKKLFSSDTYNEVPKGFEMQKNVHVSFEDIRIIEKLVTLAAKNEIYDLVKVDFFVDNAEGIYDSLRVSLQQFLQKKTDSYQMMTGLDLNEKFYSINEFSNAIYPESRYSGYDAYVTQSMEAVNKKSGVTTIRKPATVAYDQIPYSDFDIIINPEILEPAVQFTYTISLKYDLAKKPDESQSREYFIVTPNGDVRKLQIER